MSYNTSSEKLRYSRIKVKSLFFVLLTNLAAWAICLLSLVPILWIVITSFKNKADIFTMPPQWIFFKPTLANYISIFTEGHFSSYFTNSIIVTVSATLLALILGVPAAYGLSRFKFKKRENLMFWILSIRMAPPIAAVIPLFILMIQFGLYNKHIGLVIVYLLFNLPLVIWMTRGFISDIPKELDEAAMLDGCSTMGVLYRVILPNIRPGLMSTAILCIIFSWNEFMFSLVLTGIETRTLPVAVTQFISLTGVAWGPMNAASVVIALPVVIFAIAIQKNLIKGLTMGAIK